MKTVSMTEFNQHPSRVAKLAANDEVVVLRRGKAVLRIVGVDPASLDDPVDRLIGAGLAHPPRRSQRRTTPFPSIDTDIDLGAMLETDRSRLDG